MDYDRITKIICHKFHVLVIFTEYKHVFSLINYEENADNYITKESISEVCLPNTVVILNPRLQTNIEIESEEHTVYTFYTTCHEYRTNRYPLHHVVNYGSIGNQKWEHNRLIDMDTNIYVKMCCHLQQCVVLFELKSIRIFLIG